MTDAPFPETHRETLEELSLQMRPTIYAKQGAAIDAALKEIDRLTTENAKQGRDWNDARDAVDANVAEINRLRARERAAFVAGIDIAHTIAAKTRDETQRKVDAAYQRWKLETP